MSEVLHSVAPVQTFGNGADDGPASLIEASNSWAEDAERAPGEFRHPDPLIKSQLLFL